MKLQKGEQEPDEQGLELLPQNPNVTGKPLEGFKHWSEMLKFVFWGYHPVRSMEGWWRKAKLTNRTTVVILGA